MSPLPRESVLDEVAQKVLTLKLGHPVRIGIDGITAAGKSTFAKELVEILKQSGREVIATTLDGFHNPRAKRYERGRGSPEGYYHDAYNYTGVIEHLLTPLGPGGDRIYRTQIFDLKTDRPLATESKLASRDAILVVDGSFALRKDLQRYWDIRIYLESDRQIAEDRASARDAALFGSPEEARLTTRNRYHGAHAIHREVALPSQAAHFVILNNNPIHAEVIQRNL